MAAKFEVDQLLLKEILVLIRQLLVIHVIYGKLKLMDQISKCQICGLK